MKDSHPLASIAAAVAVAAVVTFGLHYGLFVAAAADAYGYVSQADLWASGSPIVRQPFAEAMTWPNADVTLAPLGYRPHRPAPHGTDIVPIYSPGLPMVMAVFRRLAGPQAVYVVVPLLGGLAVWATYLMGARLSGSLAGAFAAVLLAGSPTFLFEIVSPTSDVPCTAWWALSLALLLYEGRATAFAAGLSAGLAILTRPNVVLAAAVPGAALVWQAARERFRTTGARRESVPAEVATSNATARVLWFAAGSVPFCIAVALINNSLYGSPFSSGYAPFDVLYKWSHLLPNLARYPRWLLETETPIVLLGLAAPFVLRALARAPSRARAPATDLPRSPRWVATAWLCFVAAVFVSYLFYLPFEEWWYVRFLMPAYPPLLVLTSAVLLALLAPLSRALRGGGEIAAAVIVAVVAWRCTSFSIERGAHLQWKAEQRYATVGNYVASTLPDRAVLLSMQHSGAIRHYSGRLTVRYDLIEPADLDRVLDQLRSLDYAPFIAVEEWEEPLFRKRFEGHSALASLNWIPMAFLHSNQVRIYDPGDLQPGRPDRQRVPDVVP